MAQYCYYANKETNCTDNCKICLKEEIDEMNRAGYPEEEIKKFEQDWENQRDQYALYI